MIIVSQDRADLINFDNVKGIAIKGNNIIAIGQFTIQEEGGAYILGRYETEERAKEVLQEIIDNYKFNHWEAVGQKNSVYKMPKE